MSSKNVKTAYELIKSKIISCEYEPGQFILEKDLVEELHISRTPIREALNILVGEGFIQSVLNRGQQITSLSINRIREIYDIRLILESEAVRLAINNLRPESIDELIRMDQKLNNVFEGKRAAQIFDAGMDIHMYVAALADNKTLYPLIKTLRDQSHRACIYIFQKRLDMLLSDNKKLDEIPILHLSLINHGNFIKALIALDRRQATIHLARDFKTMKKLLTGAS